MTGSLHTSDQPAERNALTPLFVWEAAADAEAYEVELTSECTIADFRDCPFDIALRDVTTETSWRPTSPLDVSLTAPVGRRYYWRVRACRGACSAWSEVRYLDVGRQRGDLDGDGYADVVVGAPNATGTPHTEAGRVHVFAGPGLTSTREHSGGAPNVHLGAAAALVGDVDGDGDPDAVVGAPAGPGGTGLALVVLGGAGDGTQVVGPPGAAVGTEFGAAICGGDLNADGFADVVLASPAEAVGGVARAGRVYVFSGGTSGVVSAPMTVLESATPGSAQRFGHAISCAGDVTGDGIVDLLIGEPGGNRAWLFAGGPGGVLSTPVWTASIAPGPFGGPAFGASVASAGDLDGDGRAEIVVGAPEAFAASADYAGRVYGFLGAFPPSTTADADWEATLEYGYFGRVVSSAGDLDGDGLADLLEGGGVVFDGSRSGLSWESVRPVPLGGVAVGDIDADGMADVVRGDPESGAQRGGVIVHRSSDGATTTPIPAPVGATRFGASVASF